MINLSTESTEETENEIAMDAQRHSNPSRNLFLKHSLDAYYRNWVYGALTTRYLISTGHTNRLRRQDGCTYLYLTARLHIFHFLRQVDGNDRKQL